MPRANPSGYSNAGFIAVLATVLTVLSPFDITPIAGARSPAGLFTQGLAPPQATPRGLGAAKHALGLQG